MRIKVDFDKGLKASINPEWQRLSMRKARTSSLLERVNLHKEMLKIPSKASIDPKFKKLVYVRYADDWIIGIRGSRQDCVDILEKTKQYLKSELHLDLSDEKTLITNAQNESALFLSTKIKKRDHGSFRRIKGFLVRNVREIRLTAPLDKITKKMTDNGFLKKNEPSPKFL